MVSFNYNVKKNNTTGAGNTTTVSSVLVFAISQVYQISVVDVDCIGLELKASPSRSRTFNLQDVRNSKRVLKKGFPNWQPPNRQPPQPPQTQTQTLKAAKRAAKKARKAAKMAFFKAANEGRNEDLKNLIEKGVDVDSFNHPMRSGYWARTALMIAASNGHDNCVSSLLEKGAKMELKDEDGNTALIFAALYGKTNCLKTLITQGANVDAVNSSRLTALSLSKPKTECGKILKAAIKARKAAFFEAAKEGRNEDLENLIDQGVNVDSFDYKDGLHLRRRVKARTALMIAASNGHDHCVKSLFEKGAKLEARDIKGQTALIYAVSNGKTNCLKTLISLRANIDAVNYDRDTALLLAVKYRKTECLKILIENNAGTEAVDSNGKTAILYAVQNKHELYNSINVDQLNNIDIYNETVLMKCLRLLIQKSANIEAKDNKGLTALSIAAINGYNGCLKILLDQGANTEAKDNVGRTALIHAARLGKPACLKILLEEGAIIEAKDNQGMTALIRAAEYYDSACLEILLDQGAVIEVQDDLGQTALRCARSSACHQILQVRVDKLIENFRRKEAAKMAFFRAVKEGRNEDLKNLIKEGVDVNSLEDEKSSREDRMRPSYERCKKTCNKIITEGPTRTALMVAASNGHVACVKSLILEYGAQIEELDGNKRTSDGQTALMYAARNGQKDCLRTLIDLGANIDAKNNDGDTALFLAVKFRKIECLKILIEKKADMEAVDSSGVNGLYGNTALLHAVYAIQRKQPWEHSNDINIFKTLIDQKANVNATSKSNNKSLFGETALMIAAKTCNYQYLKMLLDQGADVDAEDGCGRDALDHATDAYLLASRKFEIVEVGDQKNCIRSLIRKGADTTKIVELLEREIEARKVWTYSTTTEYKDLRELIKEENERRRKKITNQLLSLKLHKKLGLPENVQNQFLDLVPEETG